MVDESKLVKRLGHRTVVVAFLGAVLAFAHAMVAFIALRDLHNDTPFGWMLLFACWISGLGVSAFLFRLLSVWCLRCKV